MGVTNLPLKDKLLTRSVKPTVNTEYSAISATTTVSKIVREKPNRLEAIITNTSSVTLYITFGRLPSSTDYSIAIPSQGVFFTDSTDAINGVWSSAGGGQANITERY